MLLSRVSCKYSFVNIHVLLLFYGNLAQGWHQHQDFEEKGGQEKFLGGQKSEKYTRNALKFDIFAIFMLKSSNLV